MSRNFLITLFAAIVVLVGFAYVIIFMPQNNNDTTNSTSATLGAETSQQSEKTTAQPDTKDLKIEDIKVGTGAAVKKGDTVVMEYTGTLTNGTKFDSSYDHGQAFTTQIGTGQVIQGWDEGIPGMKVGGERKLTIPPSMGYGSQSTGSIPANSTLIFNVKLLDIK
jgi:FKBP-type peptidyl-prolyl cis-trans isomerase